MKESITITTTSLATAIEPAESTTTHAPALHVWAALLRAYNKLIGLATPGWMAEGLQLASERELKIGLAFLFVVVSALAMGGLCDATMAQEGGAL